MMIGIQIKLYHMQGFEVKSTFEVNDTFDIQKGYSQKELFALYQKARAGLGITKYGEEQKEAK